MSNGRDVRPEHLDLVLRLLDHQITDSSRQLLGNVDDLEAVQDDDHLVVTGIVIGPAAMAQRLPGKIGDWTGAIWRRLHPAREPQATVLRVELIEDIGSAVTVCDAAGAALERTFGLEHWLRRYVISRIPGATDGGEDDDDDRAMAARGNVVTARISCDPHPEGRWLSSLVGAEVETESGRRLGKVCELRCLPEGQGDRPPWCITHLQTTRSRLGAELGYSADAGQGPRLVGAVFRHWQRQDLVIALAAVVSYDIDDWDRGTAAPGRRPDRAGPSSMGPHAAGSGSRPRRRVITVADDAQLRHPHASTTGGQTT